MAMVTAEKIETHHKALNLNLDPSIFGAFAEIGAGQEVARWFLVVGELPEPSPNRSRHTTKRSVTISMVLDRAMCPGNDLRRWWKMNGVNFFSN
jgi:hypothetical protein